MPLPTFLIAGAPRSGTTWLYDLCSDHPEIFMARPARPEPKFFLVDEDYARGIRYYAERYFKDASGYRAIGEKSANYMEDPRVPERIGRHLPDVRLLFILRNPVERAYSNYLWSCKNGIETLPFEEAIRTEAVRERAYAPQFRYARPFSYVSRGFYARLLPPWIERFDRSRIRILLTDDVVSDPAAVATDLFAFFGVSPRTPGIDLRRTVNSARSDGGPPMTAEIRETLRSIYEGPNRELESILGRDLRAWNLRA